MMESDEPCKRVRKIENPAELRSACLETLVRELGYVNAMRFLHQYETGYGDYTRERDNILPDWSVPDMVAEADQLVDKLNKAS